MKIKKLIYFVLLFCLLGFFVSCGGIEDEPIEPPVVEADSVEVTFEYNNGSATQKLSYDKGSVIKEPSQPTKFGYTFGGWYTSSDMTDASKWDFTKKVENNITLYAKWVQAEITIKEALDLCKEDGYVSSERYLIRGVIEEVTNPTYGGMVIKDDTGSIEVYGSYDETGEKRYSEMDKKPYAGDEVLFSAVLQNFKGNAEIKSGWIISFKHIEPEINESDYEAMTIQQAREAATGKLIKTTGIVAKITYANGMIPNGFYLVDESGSIYVYDSQVTPRLKIGNKITVLAEKTYWILDTEKENAKKFGYQGCCQLQNATLKENDEKTDNNFLSLCVKTSTIKEMMEFPVSSNHTTEIYKVNAVVHKREGTGFTNYYFNDLDDTTGSYTYTQCNGSDYAWLDEFDGKICTVYLAIQNAKSSASGCVYRFVPIAVKDEGYAIPETDISKFVVSYYGGVGIESSYQSDPSLEVTTSVTSTLLGFENVTLTYTSSNEEVVYFTVEEGKTIFHTKNAGTATITIRSTYAETPFEKTIEVTVSEMAHYDSVTVKEAIEAELDTEVTVKGIVGPSLVNQVGFYLIDETGVLAIKTDSDTMATLALGNVVIVKGTRTAFKADTGFAGQSCLLDSILLVNLFGEHDYSTATFDETKTLADLVSKTVDKDETTQVYVIEVTVKEIVGKYSSNFILESGESSIQLYCSSSSQYKFLKDYVDQTVKIEIALCNWNKKTPYKGCVLAVYNEDGSKTINQLNFSK